jgi:hypothetical protein
MYHNCIKKLPNNNEDIEHTSFIKLYFAERFSLSDFGSLCIHMLKHAKFPLFFARTPIYFILYIFDLDINYYF